MPKNAYPRTAPKLIFNKEEKVMTVIINQKHKSPKAVKIRPGEIRFRTRLYKSNNKPVKTPRARDTSNNMTCGLTSKTIPPRNTIEIAYLLVL